MRDKNRIHPFLEKLEEIWKENPDLRFGQLIVCTLGEDPFYIEDDKALDVINFFFYNIIK